MNTKKKEKNSVDVVFDALFKPKSLDEKSSKKLQLIRSNVIRDNLLEGNLIPKTGAKEQ